MVLPCYNFSKFADDSITSMIISVYSKATKSEVVSILRTLSVTIILAVLLGCRTTDRPVSEPRAIYNIDGRFEIFEILEFHEAFSEPSNRFNEYVGSTGLQLRRSQIYEIPNTSTVAISPRKPKLSQIFSGGLCPSERYRDQPAIGTCSGFLATSELYVTAGHCIKSEEDCTSSAFAFDIGYRSKNDDMFVRPKSDIFYCKDIVKTSMSADGEDFAIIRLDRPATTRPTVGAKMRSSGKVNEDGFLVVGHPMGLPTKVTLGGSLVANTSEKFFVADIDAYQGNSGSPVYGSAGVLEGILVRGERDFELVSENSETCWRSKTCSSTNCRGEDVVRASIILPFIQ
jgi:V8-like Glu-specific endopeptidase